MKIIPDILSTNDINRLMMDNRINQARDKLTDDKGRVDFFIDIPEDIRKKLSLSFDFEVNDRVPLRWIRGDTVLHSDYSWDHISYNNSYLVYLTDSDGLFLIDDLSFPIKSGDGYCFEEGKLHGTSGTTDDRLLLGPFNERTVPVGSEIAGVYYAENEYSVIHYLQPGHTGNFLSVEQINDITTGQKFRIPYNGIQNGWKYNSSLSYPDSNKQLIAGSNPFDDTLYKVGDSYNVNMDGGYGKIFLTPSYMITYYNHTLRFPGTQLNKLKNKADHFLITCKKKSLIP